MEEPAEIATPLVVQLVQKNHDDYVAIAQPLIEQLKRDLDRRDAEIAIIRDRIEKLCTQRWSPHPSEILTALFVADEDIAYRLRPET